jgi:hypothetical protein
MVASTPDTNAAHELPWQTLHLHCRVRERIQAPARADHCERSGHRSRSPAELHAATPTAHRLAREGACAPAVAGRGAEIGPLKGDGEGAV